MLEAEAVRRAVGSATRQLAGLSKAIVVPPGTGAAEAIAAAEGAIFGAYTVTSAAAGPASAAVKSITVASPVARGKGLRAAIKRATALGEATAYTRDLVNQPPNELYPETFAATVKKRATGTGVKVSVLDEAGLARGGFGGHLTVGGGSAHGPRLVTLRYTPAKAHKHVAFVGKGITFDSGGLTIKPKAGMTTMKCDMAGAAAVAAAVFAIAELGLQVEISAYLCLAENMPGTGACRPGDVVTMRGGKTVELNNTDAEGRMVLLEDIRPTLESPVADLLQSGPTGVIFAGWFLSEFVGNDKFGEPIPWAHLDIAGPAFNDKTPWGYTPAQGTGFGVRTLVGIAESQA